MSATRQELSKPATASSQLPAEKDAPRSTTGGKTIPGMLSVKLKKQERKRAPKDAKPPKGEPSVLPQKAPWVATRTIEKKSEKKRRVKGQEKKTRKVACAPESPSGMLFTNLAHKNVRKLVRRLDPTDERAIAVLIQCYDILNYKHKEAERMRVIRYIETFRPLKAPKPRTRKPLPEADALQVQTAMALDKESHTTATVQESALTEKQLMVQTVQRIMANVSKETLRELLQPQPSAESALEEVSELSQVCESDSEMESDEQTLQQKSALEKNLELEQEGAEELDEEEEEKRQLIEKELGEDEELDLFGDSELRAEEDE